MEGALTLLPGEDLAEVQKQVEAVVGEGAAARLGVAASVGRAKCRSTARSIASSPEAVAAVTGQPPHVNPLHTASDIRNPIVQAGIPTVGLGPLGGDLTQNGLTDEWVDVEDYRRAVKVAAAVIDGWCGMV